MKNSWGNKAWYFLHTVALAYPNNPTQKEKEDYKLFYNNLQYILPCEICRKNFKQNIIDSPIDKHLTDSISLFNWTVDIHNMVNKELNKTQITYDVAYNIYSNNGTSFTKKNIIIYGIGIIFLLYIIKKMITKK